MLQSLQIGWIDFGNKDRNKILSVLSLLSGPEAVDELGIGVVRDGFSNILFPGTSTVQTRAKYLLLVPYILLELEKQKGLEYREFLATLERKEKDLIQILKEGNAEGVIGSRAGEKIKRRPSEIYWNALHTYGIFNCRSRLSLDGYAKAVCALSRERANLYAAGRSEREEGSDDNKLPGGRCIEEFWRLPPPNKDWRNELKIELTQEEAGFLRDRILKSEHSRDSLLAFVLRNELNEVVNYDHIDIIGSIASLPNQLKIDFEMAQRFSRFIYGANIRYNIMLSDDRNETAKAKWKTWYESAMSSRSVETYDLKEPFVRLGINGRNRGRLLPFMQKWQQSVLSGNIKQMDELLIAREIELKGKERAKLGNSSIFRWQEGDWLGGGLLQYRFHNAKRIIADIFAALQGESHV